MNFSGTNMISQKVEKKSFSFKLSEFYDNHEKQIILLILVLIAILTLLIEIVVVGIFSKPKSHLKREDIYYVWLAGKQMYNGENPYDGVLGGNLVDNDKYATYLPFFYVLSLGFHLLGLTSFNHWVLFIQVLSAVFYLAISYLLFFSLYKRSFLKFHG